MSAAKRHLLHLAVMMLGVVLALLVSAAGGPAKLWAKTACVFSLQKTSHPSSMSGDADLNREFDRELDRQRPQQQAELLLERAVSRSDASQDGPGNSGSTNASVALIESRLDNWRGQLKWDSQLGDITSVALNSSDPSVRVSAIEIQITAYGLSKSNSTVDSLARQAGSNDRAQETWALWSLGLLGNRGVQPDRVVHILTAHLQNSGAYSGQNDEDTRRWAVEGLALVGTTSTIAPLLNAMHSDPSAMVRERAACSLAKSGMLSRQQRLIAVPQLINFSEDSALDAQTRGWAFQALADITQQHLPNDSTAWRNWYQETAGSGQ
ncbi:MAG: HEAT repeat domain-containing protein [Candidatus Sulfotelmatobacter sp.]